MIVSVSVDGDSTSFSLVAEIYPSAKFVCAVNDRLIPSLRDPLDPFAVTKPADVCEIRRNRVKLFS